MAYQIVLAPSSCPVPSSTGFYVTSDTLPSPPLTPDEAHKVREAKTLLRSYEEAKLQLIQETPAYRQELKQQAENWLRFYRSFGEELQVKMKEESLKYQEEVKANGVVDQAGVPDEVKTNGIKTSTTDAEKEEEEGEWIDEEDWTPEEDHRLHLAVSKVIREGEIWDLAFRFASHGLKVDAKEVMTRLKHAIENHGDEETWGFQGYWRRCMQEAEEVFERISSGKS